jgi:competence protein ComGC
MQFFKDLIGFLKGRKKLWLVPLIVVLLIIGVLTLVASSSAIAPFIYTLF